MEPQPAAPVSPEINQEGPKQKITQAILNGDLNLLDRTLVELNDLLTGGKNGYFGENFESEKRRRAELERFYEDLTRGNGGELTIFFGDSGYTRLYVSVDGKNEIALDLISDTPTKVEKLRKWEELQ